VADKLRESGAHVPNVGGYSGMAGPQTSDWLHETTGGRMGGHAPSASDWHRGKVPGFQQVHGAPHPRATATDGAPDQTARPGAAYPAMNFLPTLKPLATTGPTP